MGPDSRSPLDRDFPQGDPRSLTCRWCSRERARMVRSGRAFYYCTKCDGHIESAWTA